MTKKIVGLCLAFRGTNYGMLLQAYATQQVVEAYGFDTEIIEYHSGKNKGIKLSLAAMHVAISKIVSLIRKKMFKYNQVHLDDHHTSNIVDRNTCAKKFISQYLHNVVTCDGFTKLRSKSREYYAVLVGSDQLWMPDMSVTNFYTLRFAAPGVKRISYATSMGVSSYPNWAKKPAADFWEKIDFLSVREEHAKKIIQSICDVDVTVVADPTYLLTADQWRALIPETKVAKDGYALCYLLGNDEEVKTYCRKYADKHDLRLVGILSNECVSDDYAYCDEVITGRGPEDFVNLIRNADYVLTDSFHGLAFSVIHEKQFSIFYRKRADVKESRNSRIDNIVATWGLEDRLIKNPVEAELPSEQIDYKRVNALRREFQEESLRFLENALGVEQGGMNYIQ